MKHRTEIISLLNAQIGNKEEVSEIVATADEVAQNWVNPLSGGTEQINGLIYGLVQSGKTGVLTVTGAIGADEGYQTVLILTSDIKPLYEQTLGRVKEAFPGMDILGKPDFRDLPTFLERIKSGRSAIVASKNAHILETLIENFKKGNLKGLSCLIIDDEADQASLNTKTKKDDGTRSAINDKISQLRSFFHKNTYVQVTATPQALFLQSSEHAFRPKFTVLSQPGAGYIGGNDFFGEESDLIREFPLSDIDSITSGSQPSPTKSAPKSLLMALDTFMLAATYKRTKNVTQNCAFLCHVSTKTSDHQHIEGLLRRYKKDLYKGLTENNASLLKRLRASYDDLALTEPNINKVGFAALLERIEFYAYGIAVKLVNGLTDEDVAVHSPYNLFVGGNKLGRGVTIKNLLVSYYGRNPKKPQADTVLQHARMYGYRKADIGLLRLFLPAELHAVFKAIHRMERGLRDLIAQAPGEEFRGIYIEGNLEPTRANVIAPGAMRIYTGGQSYNPAQVLRNETTLGSVSEIDALVQSIENKTFREVSLDQLRALVGLTRPDMTASEWIWESAAIIESIAQLGTLRKQDLGYIYVDRDRGLEKARRETQGILTGGEAATVPDDRLTLFLLRTKPTGNVPAGWWPQVRFPRGRYGFASAI